MSSNKIITLEETVVRQIAAGEVVERPASVVKELLENSLDASSRRVSVEILGSGKEMIRVSDDGCGMPEEDALLALQRHTTSKIRKFEDLENLSTFGFRGEALPSISAVSRTEITTKSAQSPHGTRISVDGGKIISVKECGRDQGTTVEVINLFSNVPARLKFMKADATERSKILKTFEETAIAHPDVAFELKIGASKPTELPPRKELLDRITDIWGREFNNETMFPVSCRHPNITIEGWLSDPQAHRANKSFQIFYVNRRPIVSRTLTHALYESYRDCLPVGRNPAAVIFITLDPSQVDVNVHPSKREVRFRNEQQVYGALVAEIRLKRAQLSQAPQMFQKTDAPLNPEKPYSRAAYQPAGRTSNLSEGRLTGLYVPHAVNAGTAALEESVKTFVPAEKPKVLAQFNALYVIAEEGENLVIIDQHAASERVFYEKYRNAYASGRSVPAQALLIPFLWNVTHAQAEILKSCLKDFRGLGYALEEFGEKTFRVTETPAILPETELKNTLDEILLALENSGSATLPVDEKIISTSACRAAIKANDRLSVKELSELLEQLSACSNPHTCPHGRPTTVKISRRELDKKFGRT